MPPVKWQEVAQLLPPLVTLLVAIVGLAQGPGRARSALRHEAETLKDLPTGGPAAKAMEARIVDQIEQLNQLTSRDARRDVPMLVVALIAAPLLGWLTINLYGRDGWQWKAAAVGAGVMALLFVYGVFESARRIPRDEKGRAKP